MLLFCNIFLWLHFVVCSTCTHKIVYMWIMKSSSIDLILNAATSTTSAKNAPAKQMEVDDDFSVSARFAYIEIESVPHARELYVVHPIMFLIYFIYVYRLFALHWYCLRSIVQLILLCRLSWSLCVYVCVFYTLSCFLFTSCFRSQTSEIHFKSDIWSTKQQKW